MGMGYINIHLSASVKVPRIAKNGQDAVTYEIQLDTDSVVLDSTTRKFVTQNLGNMRFIKHEGSKMVDMTSNVIKTYSYLIVYYGYEDSVYKALTWSSNDGINSIYGAMQTNLGNDADCYAMKFLWYDKPLPENDEAMFAKIWSELDGVPPSNLGINILATKMFMVSRNGDSVKSSDVVFAIGDSRITAPTSGWITNFSDLKLEKHRYVWTCTQTTLTNSKKILTGEYCMGECYDFAQIDELYVLSDSATVIPEDNAAWSVAYSVVKGKYLWSCVKVTYSQGNSEYLNKRCVNYFPIDGKNGNDGTSFNLLGTAAGHMTTWVRPSKFTWGDIYLVDGSAVSSPKTYKITMSGNVSAKADVGDAYIIAGNLWVANTTAWVNVGNIQGAPGSPGEDALNIDLSSDKIIFSWTEKEGYDPTSKDIEIVIRQGGNIINPSNYTLSFSSVDNFSMGSANKNIQHKQSGNGYLISIFSAGINMLTYQHADDVSFKYPSSSCSIRISISYNGIVYTKIISIFVEYTKLYGDLKWDAKQLQSKYEKLESDTKGNFKKVESKISQTADEISMKVKEDLNPTGIDITNKKIAATANNFEIRNNNGATTLTIDENGNLLSGNASFMGKITATSGYIGGLEIYDDTYKVENITYNYKGLRYQIEKDGYMPEHVVNVRDRGFYVGYGNSAMGAYFQVGVKDGIIIASGGKKELLYGYFLDVNMSTTNSVTGQSANVAKLVAESNKIGIATALEVKAYGGRENYAINATSGDIWAQAGDIRADSGDFIAEKGAFIGVHRGSVTKIGDYNNGYTLKKTDSTIICNNVNNDISINLPSDAVIGTFYRVIKKGKTVTFKSSKTNIAMVNNIDLMSSVSSRTAREWINCLWDGECWLMEMSRS